MMGHFNIDSILFTIFLLANLVLGLRAGHQVKTLRDYAIGNKNFSTGILTSTIVATWIGGGFMFYGLEHMYEQGIQYIIVFLGSSLSLLFIGRILAVRMVEFINNLSVAEAMGDLYGLTVRVITAACGVIGTIGSIAIQFKVISKMLILLLDLQDPASIQYVATSITIVIAYMSIFYSAFGGIRSVIITGIFQLISFCIFISILIFIIWNQLEHPSQVAQTLATNPIFDLKQALGWNPQFLSTVGLMFYFAIPGLKPAIFQRITIAKDLGQVRKSFTYAAVFDILITLSVAWIAILLLADNPHLNPNNLVNSIITKYAYPGLKGLIAIGITAKAMTVASSYLNASAVLVVNDIIKPLNKDFKESIVVVRLFSLVIGVGGLLLALRATDFFKLLLISGSFWMPIVTVPLLLSIFGFRSSSKAVLVGMTAGITVVGLGNLFPFGIDPLIPGMVANLGFYVSGHYILYALKKWSGRPSSPAILIATKQPYTGNKWIQAIPISYVCDYLKAKLITRATTYILLLGSYIGTASYIVFSFTTDYQTFYFALAWVLLMPVIMMIHVPDEKSKVL